MREMESPEPMMAYGFKTRVALPVTVLWALVLSRLSLPASIRPAGLIFYTLRGLNLEVMNTLILRSALALLLAFSARGFAQEADTADKGGWISLFNGTDLSGWKASENPDTFSVVDGTIKVVGPRAHLFYVGAVEGHNFQNFEFKARVMTKPGANSGIYIHTRYQEEGWPEQGYEVQVNNSQEDWRRTGSLYAVQDVIEHYVNDDEWYTEYIKVEGKRIIVKLNDIVVVDYTEPEHPKREGVAVNRVLGKGTFALQGHDPGSTVYYKDIRVRPLP